MTYCCDQNLPYSLETKQFCCNNHVCGTQKYYYCLNNYTPSSNPTNKVVNMDYVIY